tara:strand:- start:67005 stop:68414 length:1410 start_codon:yes stop_codon:yes gene_type:complete
MPMNIIEQSATNIVNGIKTQKHTCLEVANAFIERIEAVNPELNAIHQFDPERIRDEARAADEKITAGKLLGKLHGLPISIKNTCYVEGFICDKGCKGLHDSHNQANATVVQQLLNEGAIILGLTNVPELLASYETDNLIYGRTNNPYDKTKIAGGSSGGEAALLAAGGSPLGLGSDAGGSVRQPAHCTGIAAHKPTHGLIPLSGCIPNDDIGIIRDILDFGPMARHIDDLRLAMSVLQRYDESDPASVVAPPAFDIYQSVDIKNCRIAYFTDNGIVAADAETDQTIESLMQQLRDAGAQVTKARPKLIEKSFEILWEVLFWVGDGGKTWQDIIANFEASPLLKQFVANASKRDFTVIETRNRLNSIDSLKHALNDFMQDYDVLICPVAARPAIDHGKTHDHIEEFAYSTTFNLTGSPATVVNAGFSQSGLPIGVQIVGKHFADGMTLGVGEIIQKLVAIPPIPMLNTQS